MYDLIIIGAGPAGLSASVYASRYRLEHLILGMVPGGQMREIHEIQNYPGFATASGNDLVKKMIEHVHQAGISIINESVVTIEKSSEEAWIVKTSQSQFVARAVLLAMGTEYKKINIPGEKEFTGKGVSYCATCDGSFFKDKVVSVVGGGNSAAVVALELTTHASHVYLIYRGEKLSADPVWIEKIRADSRIEVIQNTNILEIKGSEKVEKVVLDRPYHDKGYLETDGVFIEIGSEPGVSLARKIGVEVDDQNYIKVNSDQSTNVSGIYAAGDITTGSNKFRQVLTAAAEGGIAANSIYKKLKL